MTRLDQNRAVGQLAKRANVPINAVHNVVVWGNHSNTQYPDVTSAYIDAGNGKKSVSDAINDSAWIRGDFIKTSANTRRRYHRRFEEIVSRKRRQRRYRSHS